MIYLAYFINNYINWVTTPMGITFVSLSICPSFLNSFYKTFNTFHSGT